MAKISTYPSADNPLLLSDRLIGTEAIRPVPSPTPLATKNFSLGELLQLFSSNFPAASLQAVLNTGNTATQNINLIGTIDVTLIKPDNIEDAAGSQGATFQYLSKGASSINWVDLPVDNLQSVLNSGNTATQNITLVGNISTTKVIPGDIQDQTGNIGTTGQLLSKTSTGIRWISSTPTPPPALADVLFMGNTATNNINLIGDVTATRFIKSGGTGLEYLMADGSVTTGAASPLTTKGDLYTFSTVDTRLPVGLNTQVLLADSTTPTGLKWGTNNTPTPLGYYGAFSDVTDQFATVINTGYPMLLGITDLTNGVTVVSGSRVTIANTGIYNIQWSAQFRNPTASEHDVTIWLRKNGVDVTGSAGIVLVPKKHGSFDGHNLPSWNFLLDAIAGDYYEFVWSTQNTEVFISFEPAGNPPPSTASVVMTVTQQSGIMAGTGITAINSLTGAVQTLTVGTTGTDFAIVDSGIDHKFNLPSASDTARGLVTTGTQTLAGAKTFSTAPILSSLTASQLLATDASKNIQTLDTATYPSLTELSYSKGVISPIQTQLNSTIKAILNEFPNTSVTGFSAETLLSTFLIPANTFPVNCVPNFKMFFTKIGDGTGSVVRLYFNTTNNFATAQQLSSYSAAATTDFFIVTRNPIIDSGFFIVPAPTGQILSDESTIGTTVINRIFNPSIPIYFFISAQNGTALDTATVTTLKAFKIIN